MSKTWKQNDRHRTAFNKALKSDNRKIRRKTKEYTDKVTKDTEVFEQEDCSVRREISNPWNYD